jgi:hypothetical protein
LDSSGWAAGASITYIIRAVSPLITCLFILLAVDAGVTKEGAIAPSAAVAPVDPLARIDALHKRRDDRAALAEERQLVDAAVARAGNDYETLWRAARLYFWLGDDPSQNNQTRSKLGKVGWDLAERAITTNPKHAAGYYWAAANMGNYALGLGVVKALTQGMEGKFTDRLRKAGELDPRYQHGGIDVAWGRFYEKLPWPKRDRKKAEEHLRKVLTQLNPHHLRARVFLADTLAHDNRAAEAKRLLDEVAAAPVGRYDAPEERRAKALGVALLPEVVKLMN